MEEKRYEFESYFSCVWLLCCCFVVFVAEVFSIMICFVVVWVNFAQNTGFYMNENTCTRVCFLVTVCLCRRNFISYRNSVCNEDIL